MKSGVSLRIPLKNMALTMYYVQEKMEEKVDFLDVYFGQAILRKL